MSWDSRPTLGVQSYDFHDQSRPASRSSQFGAAEQDVSSYDKPTQAEPNHKRKRNEHSASEEEGDHIIEMPRPDGALLMESRTLDVASDGDISSPCPMKERMMVVLSRSSAAPSDKRKRSRETTTLIPESKKSKISGNAIIDYHYPQVIPAPNHRYKHRSNSKPNPRQSSQRNRSLNDSAIPKDPLLIARDGFREAESQAHRSLDQSNQSHRLSLHEFQKRVLAGFAIDWQG